MSTRRVVGKHYPGGGAVTDAVPTPIANIGENLTLRRAPGS